MFRLHLEAFFRISSAGRSPTHSASHCGPLLVQCGRTERAAIDRYIDIALIILLALLVGVLYSLHLLVQDYQALSAGRLLRFLFKRDVSSQYHHHGVRWQRILFHDSIQCARYVYCDLGSRPADTEVRRGFVFMLTLEPQEEDKKAWEIFKEAYQYGKFLKSNEAYKCRMEYPMCLFQVNLLFDLIQYLIRTH